MTIDNNEAGDDFKFEDFISEENKAEIAPETVEVTPPKDEAVVTSPQSEAETKVEVPEQKEEVKETPTEEIRDHSSEPVRAPGEPDWKYDHRLEIWQKQQELKNATSAPEKNKIKSEMDGIRRNLAERSRIPDAKSEEADLEEGEDLEIPPQQDLYKVVNDLVAQREYLGKLDSVEAEFLKEHKDIAVKENYDHFFNYVGEMYNLRGKTPGQVNAILQIAYDTLYPNQTEKKVAKSEKLEQKLDAVDFTGSSASESVDPEKEEGKKLADNIKKNSGNDFGWAVD